MRKHLPALLALLAISINPLAHAASDAKPLWADPTRQSEGQEPAFASMTVFADEASAKKLRREDSPFYRTLNGAWKYHWVSHPEKRPLDFWKTDFDDAKWGSIRVPSCVEIEGHGIPTYSNQTYPWRDVTPPVIPGDYNPVSSYRRAFATPADWRGREIFLTFDGVSSLFTVWLNGKKLGYNKDSRTPSTFRVTPHLRTDGGENILAVEVIRWNDGSYLEDQDFWRLSGIFRDVWLWSAPGVHLRDFKITTALDTGYRDATLTLSGELKNLTDNPGAPPSRRAFSHPKANKSPSSPSPRKTSPHPPPRASKNPPPSKIPPNGPPRSPRSTRCSSP
nr:sugar-binding domain-containing protein [Ereboglobus luteus]